MRKVIAKDVTGIVIRAKFGNNAIYRYRFTADLDAVKELEYGATHTVELPVSFSI